MFTDARTLPANAEIAADVCIVGGGPAGVALALALAMVGSALRVVLLESGGLENDPVANDLGRSEAGLHFGGLARLDSLRRFAGNAAAWSVRTPDTSNGIRLVPFAAADLEPKSWLPHSGWPIGFGELVPFYRRAQSVFGLPDAGYDAAEWQEAGSESLPLREDRVRTRMYQFGDGRRFTEDHRRTLEGSSTVTVFEHATALGLESEADTGRVAAVCAETVPGRGLRVRAARVVLAGGALPTTQLLLSSVEEGALRMGRAAGSLGRYFMDHPLLHGGEFFPSSPALLDAMALYDLRGVRGTPVMGHLELADEVLRNERALNLSALLFPRAPDWADQRPESPREQTAVAAALRVRQSLRARARPSASDVRQAALGVDDVARRALRSALRPSSHLSRGGWSSESSRARRRYDRFEVTHQAEQAPHYDNRVLLGEARDAFGTRRITVDWRWHDEDVAATMRAQEVFAQELERAGIGRFEIARQDGRPVVHTPSTGHFMGTTRMSVDAGQGVVDRNCQVHGIENLFVASGSVIPSGGFANPTLTIVALALRVADHLRTPSRAATLTSADGATPAGRVSGNGTLP